MALQVAQNREALPLAPIARKHLRAVTPLEVVLHAYHRFQRPEFLVPFVSVAADVRARESDPRAELRPIPLGLRQSLPGLEPVPVCAHVHPQVRVALEPFPAYLAEVDVLGEQFDGVKLHDLDVSVAVVFFVLLRNPCLRFLLLDFQTRNQIPIRRVGYPRGGDESRAADDDLLDGGGDLGGHRVHLVLA